MHLYFVKLNGFLVNVHHLNLHFKISNTIKFRKFQKILWLKCLLNTKRSTSKHLLEQFIQYFYLLQFFTIKILQVFFPLKFHSQIFKVPKMRTQLDAGCNKFSFEHFIQSNLVYYNLSTKKY